MAQASATLKNNVDTLAAIEEKLNPVENTSDMLKDDKALVLEVVKQNGLALKNAPVSMKKDK